MKTLVLGASPKSDRYSYKAVERLRAHGHETVALGRNAGHIAEQEIIPTSELHKADLSQLHTITLYLAPENQPEFYPLILQAKPQRVIFNPGTENPELYKLLREQLPQTQQEIACTLVLLATGGY